MERNIETRVNATTDRVQALDIPQDLKELYKTVWEMSERHY
jgi:hypothetical protein